MSIVIPPPAEIEVCTDIKRCKGVAVDESIISDTVVVIDTFGNCK